MGFHRHHVVVVTSWNDEHLAEAHAKATQLYRDHMSDPDWPNIPNIVGPVVSGVANGEATFTIVPDGSKEGWSTSQDSDDAREEFIAWLRETTQVDYGRERYLYLDWVVVEFGGDAPEHAKILAHNGDESWRDGNGN